MKLIACTSEGWSGWRHPQTPAVLLGPVSGWWPLSGAKEVRKRGVATTWCAVLSGRSVYVRHRRGLKGGDPKNLKTVNALRWGRGGHRGARAAEAARLLAADGFCVPVFLLVLRRQAGAKSEELLVTEAIDAAPLTDCLNGQADPTAVLASVGRELARLHQAGWEHRELEPGNVLISADGRVHFIDLEQVRQRRPAASWRRKNLIKLLARLKTAGCHGRRLQALTRAYEEVCGDEKAGIISAALWRGVRRRAAELVMSAARPGR